MLDALDASALRRWCERSMEALGEERAEIDALNVFPVADGDTGTNLFLTMESAAAAVSALGAGDTGSPPTLAEVLRAVAHGAFLGARGNSGVILSQMLRGMAHAVAAAPDLDVVDGVVLRRALAEASSAAYDAVGSPVDGTMLSVIRAAADAAAHTRSTRLGEVVEVAHSAARASLAASPHHLEVLRRHGVVDAGGAGVVVLLRVLEEIVTGVRLTAASRPRYRAAAPALEALDVPIAKPVPAYEVMYLLESDDARVADLRKALGDLGDSLLVVGGDGLWNIHVHVDDAGAAIEAGIAAGRPYRVRVSHLATDVGADCVPRQARAVVVIVDGPGLVALAEQAGALAIAAEDVTSSVVVRDAILSTAAREVLVLASEEGSRAAAEAAARGMRAEGVRVAVLPVRAAVQALAALAVHDSGSDFDDDVVSMTAAAGATRYATVSVALTDAVTMAGVCTAGDVLGLVEGEVVVIGSDARDVGLAVVGKMLSAGGELVTLVHGRDDAERLAKDLAHALHTTRPDVVCDIHSGGQSRDVLLIGVE